MKLVMSIELFEADESGARVISGFHKQAICTPDDESRFTDADRVLAEFTDPAAYALVLALRDRLGLPNRRRVKRRAADRRPYGPRG